MCPQHLLGVCPYDMFRNTKSDLGQCPKVSPQLSDVLISRSMMRRLRRYSRETRQHVRRRQCMTTRDYICTSSRTSWQTLTDVLWSLRRGKYVTWPSQYRLADEGKLMPESDSRLRTISASVRSLMNKVEVCILWCTVIISHWTWRER